MGLFCCVRRKKMKSTDSVIVSWDFSHGKDVGVLIVGKQEKGKVEIINAYQKGEIANNGIIKTFRRM